MSTLMYVRCDGPDNLIVAFGDPRHPMSDATTVRVLKPGQELRMSISVPMRFATERPPTLQELAEANGVSVADMKKALGVHEPTRYADSE